MYDTMAILGIWDRNIRIHWGRCSVFKDRPERHSSQNASLHHFTTSHPHIKPQICMLPPALQALSLRPLRNVGHSWQSCLQCHGWHRDCEWPESCSPRSEPRSLLGITKDINLPSKLMLSGVVPADSHVLCPLCTVDDSELWVSVPLHHFMRNIHVLNAVGHLSL